MDGLISALTISPCRPSLAAAQAPRDGRPVRSTLRALRRDRAARIGPELFLFDRAFDECLDRLRDHRPAVRRAPADRLPVPGMAAASANSPTKSTRSIRARCSPRPLAAAVEEDRFDFGEERYDLLVAIGTLDSVNDLPLALEAHRRALRPDAPLIGAMRRQQPARLARQPDRGRPSRRPAPRPNPSADRGSDACGAARAAGFSMPVVDVDRVALRYSDLATLWSATCGRWAPPTCWREPSRALTRGASKRQQAVFGRGTMAAGPRKASKFFISSVGANNRGKRRINLVTPMNR